MKNEEVRKNVLSTKTTDSVISFIMEECKATGFSPSTQVHKILDKDRRSKARRKRSP
jgi:hypothetical protein